MKPFLLAALAATAFTLTGCGEKLTGDKPLNVVSGHIVMGATPDRPAAGYFRIQGGPRDVQLVAVTSDLAQRVEMHEAVRENGMTTMKPLLSADVPAKGELEFKQGGKHLMIWNINGAAVRNGKLPMAFVFTNNNNERILFDLPIKQPEGAPADDHGGMAHDTEKASADAAGK